MPKSLNQVTRNVDKGRIKRAENVHIKHKNTRVSRKNYWIKEYVYETYTRPEDKYVTTIRPLNPTKYDLRNGNEKAFVSCSCPDFLYRWEYALAKHGASEIKHSNGNPAVVTNPSNKASVCKHLFAIKDDVLKKNKDHVAKMQKRKDFLNPNKPISKGKIKADISDLDISDLFKVFGDKK